MTQRVSSPEKNVVEPYIPADRYVPEFTPKAILVGAVLAMAMAATNAYLGLKVGMTVSATIPAAVISLAIFRAFGGTILEANLSKTMASAGESLAAGVIFTIPAFILIGAWKDFDYVTTTLIALIGGVLGVLFTISLRRILIEEEALPYPEGVASAEVLFAGWEGGTSARYVFAALVVGLFYKSLSAALRLVHDRVEGVIGLGKAKFYLGGDLSAALVSVGYIIGPRISSYVFLGGVIGWVLVLPIFLSMAFSGSYPGIDPSTMSAVEVVMQIKNEQIIWIGIGAIVFGGIWTMFTIRQSVGGAFGEAMRGIKTIRGGDVEKKEVPRTEQDLPVDKSLLVAMALVIPIGGLYFYLTSSALIAGVGAVVMVVAAFFFTAIAGYLAGVVGSSNNPISGVTITTLLFASLLLLMLGARGPSGMAGALGVGAVVCCAAAIAGDVLQDFKTGQIVGSTPKYLQLGEMIGVVATALVIAPILMLLYRGYGIGPGTGLEAPQAQAMSGLLTAVFGGTVNYVMFLAGMELAVLLILFDIPILAVAIGIYLPFTLSTPIMLGGILHAVVDRIGRKNRKEDVASEKLHNRGILYSSGLIAGEAFAGILAAGVLVAYPDFSIIPEPVPVLGPVLFLVVVFLLYKTAVEGVGGNIKDGWWALKELARDTVKNARKSVREMLRL